MLLNTFGCYKRWQKILWRNKMPVSMCPCLTFSAAMSCLDAKISLAPKHKLIVPSTLLAPATHIQTDKATMIHMLRPLTYELFFRNTWKTNVYPTIQIYCKIQYSPWSANFIWFLQQNTVLLNMQYSTLWMPYSVMHWSKTYKLLNIGATVCFNGRQTSNVWHPSIRTFLPARSIYISFFSTVRHIYHSETAHLPLQIIFNAYKNTCKEYFVERKQIKSTTAAYSKLRMFGGKTCHVCTQLEHVFSSRVHA